MRITGFYQHLGPLNHFIPSPLPPTDPPFVMSVDLLNFYSDTVLQLGKLSEMATRVPSVHRFIKAYVIREALLSSAIEGIHTTMLDVYTQPFSEEKPSKETSLVLNYTRALDSAMELIVGQGLPIVSRVLLSAHDTLMRLGDDARANPGNYRQQSVRVGELIPPPAQQVALLMADLERFINADNSLPPLIKAGLAHVQFETIHPFLDGNGRIGRMLIVLMLVESKLIPMPILYPSLYFKRHHQEYYRRLDAVRQQGDFEGWITYFLQAIQASSLDAYQRAKDIEQLERELFDQVQKDTRFAKMRETSIETIKIMFQLPIISTTELAQQLGKTFNAASKVIALLIEAGILQPAASGKSRSALFCFAPYMRLLEREY